MKTLLILAIIGLAIWAAFNPSEPLARAVGVPGDFIEWFVTIVLGGVGLYATHSVTDDL